MIDDEKYISPKYLDRCLENVETKFDNIEQALVRIEKHLEKQNSSITELQTESNKRLIVVEDFRHLEKDFNTFVEKDFGSVKIKVDNIDKKLLEVWFFLKHPKVFFGMIIVIVSATLGFSYFNNRKNSDIEKKVNNIESYVKIPNAQTRILKAYPDTLNY